MLNWKELRVFDTGCTYLSDLGAIVATSPTMLDNITLSPEDGSITIWPDYFICAPNEYPDWDTPRCEVDWSGFEEALP